MKKLHYTFLHTIYMLESNILLAIIQLVHFFIDAFCMFYVFIFNPIYDIYYSSFIFSQTIHWGLLKNECIVSYIEKKLMDPNYTLGDKPKWIPHYKIYHNKITIFFKAVLILGGLTFVIFRNRKNNIPYICIGAIILWLYFTYFYYKSQL
jgi:hypothetical protein